MQDKNSNPDNEFSKAKFETCLSNADAPATIMFSLSKDMCEKALPNFIMIRVHDTRVRRTVAALRFSSAIIKADLWREYAQFIQYCQKKVISAKSQNSGLWGPCQT